MLFKKRNLNKKQLINQLFNDYNQTVMQNVLFVDEGPLSVYFVLLRTNPTYIMNMKTAKRTRLTIASRMFCEKRESTCSLVFSSWQVLSTGLEFEVGASFVIDSTSLFLFTDEMNVLVQSFFRVFTVRRCTHRSVYLALTVRSAFTYRSVHFHSFSFGTPRWKDRSQQNEKRTRV